MTEPRICEHCGCKLATTVPTPIDPSLAFTALLELYPGYGQMSDPHASELRSRFLADWWASNHTDMWAYAREWVEMGTAPRPGGLPAGTVQVKRDGIVQETFSGDDPVRNSNDAFTWLLRHQPMSTDWAIKYEGWEITDPAPSQCICTAPPTGNPEHAMIIDKRCPEHGTEHQCNWSIRLSIPVKIAGAITGWTPYRECSVCHRRAPENAVAP